MKCCFKFPLNFAIIIYCIETGKYDITFQVLYGIVYHKGSPTFWMYVLDGIFLFLRTPLICLHTYSRNNREASYVYLAVIII